MITIFSCPKPFTGHIETIQRNAILSWKLLDPSIDIILIGDEKGTSKMADELGIRHIPEIQRNEYGTPLISDIFEKGQKFAKYDVFCYINSDIILMSDFMDAVKQAIQYRHSFLLIGQRYDLTIDRILDFSADWEKNLIHLMLMKGQLHAKTGIDYFVFRGSFLQEFPPFAVGRPVWDNWVIYHARSHHIDVIDATPVVHAIHQNHDYTHVPKSEGRAWEGPEARKNRSLYSGRIYSISDSNYYLLKPGITIAGANCLLSGIRDCISATIQLLKKVKVWVSPAGK